MTKYVIEGGTPLRGEINISGAKNAAVAILPAAILIDGVCTIENIPNISDVTLMLDIMRELGAKVKMIDSTSVEIDSTEIHTCKAPYDMVRTIRASYYLIGALLGRFGEAQVALPGGCYFGVRPIDQHIKGFTALGADVNIENGFVVGKSEGRLRGANVYLDVVSVGATMNIMLAATLAEGLTVIENAAKEPHIVDLANFLNSMGADISGAGTDTIKIRGVEKMAGGAYAIIPDQIEAGTYMVAAAATGGELLIKNVIPKHLECITAKLLEMGVEVEEFDEEVLVKRSGPLKPTNIKTQPYPGFPTDMQPQATVLLSIAQGASKVAESVWDNRFRYVEELHRMGANICIQASGKVADIEGVPCLKAARVRACDLRAGAAMVIAALSAEGVSEIEDIVYIERGYEEIVEKLKAVGAKISRVEIPDGPAISHAQ